MVQSGEADFLIYKWFGRKTCKTKSPFYSIDIVRLKDLFIILAVSILIAAFLLLIEVKCYKIYNVMRRARYRE